MLIEKGFSLPALRTLKLRQTLLSDASINTLIPLVPNIKRVDVSFTDIRRPLLVPLHGFSNIEKLSVTSTSVSPDDLLSVLSDASQLRTLNIGALGGSYSKRSAFGRGMSTMTFTDKHLRSLTAILSQNTVIENISLVANTKVARDEEIIAEFILLVGRRLKVRGSNSNTTGTGSLLTLYMLEIKPHWAHIPSVIRLTTPRPG